MAQFSSLPSALPNNPREQPWLLPFNRKLRNLTSISLRNLSLSSTDNARGSTSRFNDDDALPNTRRSPAKIVAQREQKALAHSRSSSDLRTSSIGTAIEEDDGAENASTANGSPKSAKQRQRPYSTASPGSKRPEIRRMRRRSTIGWAESTPLKRQQRLEDVMSERLLDVFFSLHVQGIEEPVYTSEAVANTMNPTFEQIDWSACGPGITRSGQLTIRIWTRSGRKSNWRQMLQFDIDMRGLRFLGRSLDSLDRQLPSNAVLLHLTDGIYIATTTLPYTKPQTIIAASRPSTAQSNRISYSSAFDSLLRLARLDDSIQDALAIRNKIANDLETLLKDNSAVLVERDQSTEINDRIKTIEFAKLTVQKQLDKARRQTEEKRASLAMRRSQMEADKECRKLKDAEIENERPHLPNDRDDLEIKQKAIQNQRRRICEELQLCYPIQPQPGKALAFTIRDLHLPNSEDLDTESPETVAAALGYVAHVLQLLSFYLEKPLAYTISSRGSASTIFDAISILKTNTPLPAVSGSLSAAEIKLRTYPLFSKSVPRFRFEYAVFLLNQNIRLLLDNAFGVRVLDIRHTLPNLKYLLYVATAGEGDLPARKAGGVRGLLRAPALERSGSSDSTNSRLSGLTLAGLGFSQTNGNGKTKSAAERLREFDLQK